MNGEVRELESKPMGVSCFKDRNFVTPVLVGYYESEAFYFEVSKTNQHWRDTIGKGKDMYGVTVAAKANPDRQEHPYNGAFYSMKDAMAHLEQVAQMDKHFVGNPSAEEWGAV